METTGQRLKRVRERLGLRYREVEEASQQIARKRRNPEYALALSRLADIENKGTVPNIFRMYSLCSIYRMDMREMMRWYGVEPDEVPAESTGIPLRATHLAGFADVLPPPTGGPEREVATAPEKTTFLSQIHRWGKVSSVLLPAFDSQHYRYGYIGLEDWSMHPVLEPGALVLIDTRRRKVAAGGWTSERERPIYFLEHRSGYVCGWCSLVKDTLMLQPHPASSVAPTAYRFPEEIEVVGEVVGAATIFPSKGHRVDRGSAVPAVSPNP